MTIEKSLQQWHQDCPEVRSVLAILQQVNFDTILGTQGVRKLLGDNLKVVWAKFSTLS